MTIKATFTGTPSLGYKTGCNYLLHLEDTQLVTIKRLDGTGVCEYHSLAAFINNWNEISVITDTSYLNKKITLDIFKNVADAMEKVPDKFCKSEAFLQYAIEVNARIKNLKTDLDLIGKL